MDICIDETLMFLEQLGTAEKKDLSSNGICLSVLCISLQSEKLYIRELLSFKDL